MRRPSRPGSPRRRVKAQGKVIRRAARPAAAAEVVARIEAAGLIAIHRVRGLARASLAARTLREAGVSALEVILTTPEALQGLGPLREAMGPEALLGVGTVLDVTAARAALEAGAQFLVTSILDTEVIALGVRRGVPVLPGAFSPTEIYRAWRAGAPLIKVFPAGVLGPQFFRDVRGPLPEIRLVPTGEGYAGERWRPHRGRGGGGGGGRGADRPPSRGGRALGRDPEPGTGVPEPDSAGPAGRGCRGLRSSGNPPNSPPGGPVPNGRGIPTFP